MKLDRLPTIPIDECEPPLHSPGGGWHSRPGRRRPTRPASILTPDAKSEPSPVLETEPARAVDERLLDMLYCHSARLEENKTRPVPMVYRVFALAIVKNAVRLRANAIRQARLGKPLSGRYVLSKAELADYSPWLSEIGFDQSIPELVNMMELAAERYSLNPAQPGRPPKGKSKASPSLRALENSNRCESQRSAVDER